MLLEQALIWLIVFLPIFIVFNRIRGGGLSWLTDHLPGRALYYVGFFFGGFAFATFGNIYLAAFLAVGFIAGGSMGWGLWFDLHRHDDKYKDDKRWNDPFVKIIWAISFKNDYIALWWRMMLFVAPFILPCFFYFTMPFYTLVLIPVFSALIVAGYEIGHRTSWGITTAEFITGGLWNILVLLMWLIIML